MKIYAPVKNTNGVYASVRFTNGVGETDNPRLIQWFRQNGYTVETEENTSDVGKITHDIEFVDINKIADEPEMMGYAEKQPNIDRMTDYELREWMLSQGYNVRNTRNRKKLLEMLKG